MIDGVPNPYCSNSQSFVMGPQFLDLFQQNGVVDQLDTCPLSTIYNYVDNYIKNSQLSNGGNCSDFQSYTCKVIYLFIHFPPVLDFLYGMSDVSISYCALLHVQYIFHFLLKLEYLQLYSRYRIDFFLSIEWVG